MILKEVRNNKIESFFIVSGFLLFITLIIYFICVYFDLGPMSAVIALAFSVLTSIISYYNSDKIVLSMNNARPATEEEDKLLTSILDELCIASGLPRPKLYVIDDPSPNAFATGRNPENAVICFTTGIIEKLDRYELEGVMAHELSHIKNYDILLSTIVSVFVGFVVIVADLIFRFPLMRGRNNDRESGNSKIIIQLVGLIFLILSPIFAQLIQLAISRKREFLADASSVEITRNPSGLISALRKLDDDRNSMHNVSKATSHMYIVNPLNDERKKEKSNIFSTHPSIDERIERLEHIN